MKILFLAPLPPPMTGHSLACGVLLEALVSKHQVDLVDLKKQGFRQGLSSLGRVCEVLRMAFAIMRKRRKAELIYFTISESVAGNFKDILFYVLLIGKLDRTIIHLHGGAGIRELLSSSHPVTRWLNAVFLRRLRGVIVLGQRHVPTFDGLIPLPRIHIVQNFAPDDVFVTPAIVMQKFAQLRPLRILFLSNLLPGKGHEELLQAVLSLAPYQQDLLAVDFAGGFETDGQREKFVHRISQAGFVRYHGSVTGDAKRALFRGAHLFCLPTYYPYEGQPISILEAYASGCAVMTTDHSGIFDVFTDKLNGFAVAKESVQSIRDTLVRLLDAPELLREIGERNRTMAESRFRAERYIKDILEIIEGAATQASR